MDPNQPNQTQPIQPTTPVQTVPVAPQPVAQAPVETPAVTNETPPIVPPTHASANKLLLSMVIILFFLAVGIGTYIALSPKESQQVAQTTPQAVTPTDVPTIAQTPEEQEVDSIILTTLDADFAEIEKDLVGL